MCVFLSVMFISFISGERYSFHGRVFVCEDIHVHLIRGHMQERIQTVCVISLQRVYFPFVCVHMCICVYVSERY